MSETRDKPPGCLCEGWGVGDRSGGVSGWANRDYGGPSANLTVVDFATQDVPTYPRS